ncbi:type II secretion system F family protein [Bacillaceae bacterium Marseille-Q3522]|nr:type II secretion system F family protein [Bacillaceae bacterium Marseille-Q3522]
MARFKYIGRDRNGKKAGKLAASSKREAMFKLRDEGIRVIEITEIPESFLTREIVIGNPVKSQDLVVFLRQFATLLAAGVTIVVATRILAGQTESKALRKVLLEMEQSLQEGNPLSEAMAQQKKVFSPIFINMIKAGEIGGNMDETLERLATHFEKQHHTKQKLVAALTYPIFITVIATLVVVFLFLYIVPIFVDLFADIGGELPAITRFVLALSNIISDFWWLGILVLFALIAGVVLMRRKKETKYYFDYFLLRLPVYGMIMRKAAIAAFTRTLSSLFSSSVPILQALTIAEHVVGNEVIAAVIKKAHNSLEKGESLTAPMKKHWAFPPLVTQMIAIGEETGSLNNMLDKVADFYEKEVETSTDRLKALLEPLMIVILAAIVGTIILSIMVPMFEIFNQVGNY